MGLGMGLGMGLSYWLALGLAPSGSSVDQRLPLRSAGSEAKDGLEERGVERRSLQTSGGGSSSSDCLTGWHLDAATNECEQCPQGHFREGAVDECSVCEAGRYQSVRAEPCAPCPGGRFRQEGTPAWGLAACVACDAGQYQRLAARPCTACAAGTFSDEQGTQYGCSACPPGTYTSGGATVCTVCPAGRFDHDAAQHESAATDCEDCAAGRTSGNGATECEACLAGRYDHDAAVETALPALQSYSTAQGRTTITLRGNPAIPLQEGDHLLLEDALDDRTCGLGPKRTNLVVEEVLSTTTVRLGEELSGEEDPDTVSTDCVVRRASSAATECEDCAAGFYDHDAAYATPTWTLPPLGSLSPIDLAARTITLGGDPAIEPPLLRGDYLQLEDAGGETCGFGPKRTILVVSAATPAIEASQIESVDIGQSQSTATIRTAADPELTGFAQNDIVQVTGCTLAGFHTVESVTPEELTLTLTLDGTSGSIGPATGCSISRAPTVTLDAVSPIGEQPATGVVIGEDTIEITTTNPQDAGFAPGNTVQVTQTAEVECRIVGSYIVTEVSDTALTVSGVTGADPVDDGACSVRRAVLTADASADSAHCVIRRASSAATACVSCRAGQYAAAAAAAECFPCAAGRHDHDDFEGEIPLVSVNPGMGTITLGTSSAVVSEDGTNVTVTIPDSTLVATIRVGQHLQLANAASASCGAEPKFVEVLGLQLESQATLVTTGITAVIGQAADCVVVANSAATECEGCPAGQYDHDATLPLESIVHDPSDPASYQITLTKKIARIESIVAANQIRLSAADATIEVGQHLQLESAVGSLCSATPLRVSLEVSHVSVSEDYTDVTFSTHDTAIPEQRATLVSIDTNSGRITITIADNAGYAEDDTIQVTQTANEEALCTIVGSYSVAEPPGDNTLTVLVSGVTGADPQEPERDACSVSRSINDQNVNGGSPLSNCVVSMADARIVPGEYLRLEDLRLEDRQGVGECSNALKDKEYLVSQVDFMTVTVHGTDGAEDLEPPAGDDNTNCAVARVNSAATACVGCAAGFSSSTAQTACAACAAGRYAAVAAPECEGCPAGQYDHDATLPLESIVHVPSDPASYQITLTKKIARIESIVDANEIRLSAADATIEVGQHLQLESAVGSLCSATPLRVSLEVSHVSVSEDYTDVTFSTHDTAIPEQTATVSIDTDSGRITITIADNAGYAEDDTIQVTQTANEEALCTIVGSYSVAEPPGDGDNTLTVLVSGVTGADPQEPEAGACSVSRSINDQNVNDGSPLSNCVVSMADARIVPGEYLRLQDRQGVGECSNALKDKEYLVSQVDFMTVTVHGTDGAEDLEPPAEPPAGDDNTNCAVARVNSAATACVGCAAGFSSSTAQTACAACAAGRYAAVAAPECEDCPAGQYDHDATLPLQSGGGASTQCQPCVAGQYTDRAGDLRCFQCDHGTYAPANQTSCTPCPPGQYDHDAALPLDSIEQAINVVDNQITLRDPEASIEEGEYLRLEHADGSASCRAWPMSSNLLVSEVVDNQVTFSRTTSLTAPDAEASDNCVVRRMNSAATECQACAPATECGSAGSGSGTGGPAPAPAPAGSSEELVVEQTTRRFPGDGPVMTEEQFAANARASLPAQSVIDLTASVISVTASATITLGGWGNAASITWNTRLELVAGLETALRTAQTLFGAAAVGVEVLDIEIEDARDQSGRRRTQQAVDLIMVSYRLSSQADIACALNQMLPNRDDRCGRSVADFEDALPVEFRGAGRSAPSFELGDVETEYRLIVETNRALTPDEQDNIRAASACVEGFYGTSADVDVWQCVRCNEGQYAGPEATACADCEAGWYDHDRDASTECLSCEAGFYTGSVTQTACVSCSAGQYAPQGATECTGCDAGQYAGMEAHECLICEAGRYDHDSDASTTCELCADGFSSIARQTTCFPCSAGQYATPGAAACIVCPAGRYDHDGDASTGCLPSADCEVEYSPCTELCESGQDRRQRITVEPSGDGAPCPSAEDCEPGMGGCEESLLFPDNGPVTEGNNLGLLLFIMFICVCCVIVAVGWFIDKRNKQRNVDMSRSSFPGSPGAASAAAVAVPANRDHSSVTRTDSPMVNRYPPQQPQQRPPQPQPQQPSAFRQHLDATSSWAPTPGPASGPRTPGPASGPRTAFRQAGNMAAVANSMRQNASFSAPDPELGQGQGQESYKSVEHAADINVVEADENLTNGIERFEASDFLNAQLGCRLAICIAAPAAASRPPPQVLRRSVYYKLAIAAYATVQAISAQLKRDPHSVLPEQQRRQVLLCIFLCSLDVEPRHRVRLMRRTILLMMRNGNWGLAAMYLEVMRAHAHKNRDKLDAELDECRANGLRNKAGMVPDEVSRADSIGGMTLQQAANYLEQARLISRDLALRDAGANTALAQDSECLGLMYYLLDDPRKALRCCQEGLSAVSAAREAALGAQPSGAELPLPVLLAEADLRASLCLVHHAVGDAHAADQAQNEMLAVQRRAADKARAEQQQLAQTQQQPSPEASFQQEQFRV